MIASPRRKGPWILYGVMLVLLAIALWLGISNSSFDPFIPVAILMMLGYGTVGAVIASRRRGGPLGWLMLTIGIGFVLTALTDESVTYAYVTNPRANVPFVEAVAWVGNWAFFFVVTPIVMILLLFPTGTPPSNRWRPLVPTIIGLAGLGVVASVLSPGPMDFEAATIPNPTGVAALRDATRVSLFVVAGGLLAAAVVSVVALILRARRARGDERQQIRWLAYLAVLALSLLIAAAISGTAGGGTAVDDAVWLALLLVVGVAFPVAIGVAIFKYRLYDLDVVVKKTVLYASVALLLIVMYVVAAGVVGGTMIDAPAGAIIAWFLIGLAFWPAVRVARRLADRIVYGGRATPYEVLTDFSQRVSESYAAEDVLPRMARILAGAVGAVEAIVWLRVGSDLRPAGRSPAEGPAPPNAAIHDDALPRLPGDAAVEVRDQGELLGALTIDMPANDPMDPSKERLVRDLAAQAGLVLRNVRLIEELRASRQRLVAAQDAERRRLERDIHDGVQQQLVALTVQLRLLEQVAVRDPAKASRLAAQLQLRTTETLEDLRDLARGIYPPLLADEGLAAALSAQARKLPLPIAVDADGIGRYSQDVEAAVYFSCLEALNNIAKYAEASNVTISLARDDRRLTFRVVDDGVGFDPGSARGGTGLQGIADRVDALGGLVEIHSHPGAGTTVAGSIPVG
ncbi:MAG: histidine kinase [Actinomycetota bacterium]|nr:histidine kinase [Actinomycetota bacterium]